MDSDAPTEYTGVLSQHSTLVNRVSSVGAIIGIVFVFVGMYLGFLTDTQFLLGSLGGLLFILCSYLILLTIMGSRLVRYQSTVTPRQPERQEKERVSAKDTCILLPTMNEDETVGDVIEGFQSEGFDNILVIDGGSVDNTQRIAREHGARVIEQSGAGKGQAVIEAVSEHIETPYVVMCDADGTYETSHVHWLLDPVVGGRADHVIADRFAVMDPDAMGWRNRLGNKLANAVFSGLFRVDYGDILSGYRVFSRESFERLPLHAEGFEIEANIAVELATNRVRTGIVPSRYYPRPDDSTTNLSPYSDGPRIMWFLVSRAYSTTPFASVATAIFTTLLLSVIGRAVIEVSPPETRLGTFAFLWVVSAVGVSLALLFSFIVVHHKLRPHRLDIPRIDHSPQAPISDESPRSEAKP